MQKELSPRGIPRFVGRAEVAEALGYSLKTLNREIKRGHVPRPVQLSPNRVGWPVEVIQKLLESRIARVKEQAVSDPNKLPPEQLANAIAREMSRQLGEDVEPADVIFGSLTRLSPRRRFAFGSRAGRAFSSAMAADGQLSALPPSPPEPHAAVVATVLFRERCQGL